MGREGGHREVLCVLGQGLASMARVWARVLMAHIPTGV